MITRVLSTGLLAGFLAGVTIAALQNFTTTPLILAAEVFENAEKAASAEGVSDEARVILVHSAEEHGSAAAGGAEEWAPEDGIERIFYTSTATIATSIGFAFLLLAGMLACRRRHQRAACDRLGGCGLRGDRACSGGGSLAGAAGNAGGGSRCAPGLVVPDGYAHRALDLALPALRSRPGCVCWPSRCCWLLTS